MKINELHEIFLKSDGITTDTRKIKKNELFFALKGDSFDGNKFALKALNLGVAFSIIDNEDYFVDSRMILVENVLKTLQELALFHRKYLKLPIIAITGTNGKTTTKELVREVLSQKYNVTATKGNLNNHIGVPLTILSMNETSEIGIVEMGANHIGEIAELCEIAKPDYGLITNIGYAHIEGFGSFEGVIKTKSELYNYIFVNDNTIFINSDDSLLKKLSKDFKKIEYCDDENFVCFVENIDSDPFLKLKWENSIIKTNLIGSYNFYNVLAAITIANYFKIEKKKIISAIEKYFPQNNRSQFIKTNNNTLIVDAYNANPSSMLLAIKNFADIKVTSKVLIVGDMFELGNKSVKEHSKIINLINNYNFDKVIFVGYDFYELSKGTNKKYLFFKTTNELIEYLKNKILNNKYILLKASRGIMLEKTLKYL